MDYCRYSIKGGGELNPPPERGFMAEHHSLHSFQPGQMGTVWNPVSRKPEYKPNPNFCAICGRKKDHSLHGVKHDATMVLFLEGVIRREVKHRSISDQRRSVNYVLASYRGTDGCEYRKSFESYSAPIVPDSGTHKDLNKLAIQY